MQQNFVGVSLVYSHPDPSSSTDLFLTNSGLNSRYLALERTWHKAASSLIIRFRECFEFFTHSSNDPSHTLSPDPSSLSLAWFCISLMTRVVPEKNMPESSKGKKLRSFVANINISGMW